MKKSKLFITTNEANAVALAKHGLRYNDKTMRLKNVRIQYLTTVCKCQFASSVKVIADTDMCNDTEMVVGICHKHANIIKIKDKGFQFKDKPFQLK